ncbi:MAG: AAA domain-containing protein [Acidobacteria bacterium]|nr:AAA domain-containing protein [Acidobacteriota bacterium]MYE43660.1 AAA domain-containing protein [Acidobacteriota bacterium]
MRSSGNAPEPKRLAAGLVAASAAMRSLLEEAARVARFDVPVLIEGETGSGKELLARYVHRRSPRRDRPLVAVNCGALPDGLLEAEFFGHARGAFTGADAARPGLLEAADGGTLFLDEVGELSPQGQATLLRVLQEREFRRVGEIRVRRSDFRLIAATHRPLAELAAAREFRRDLFYRLRVVRLRLPPLRERRSEIPELAATLLARLARRHRLAPARLSAEALESLARRHWPGNVRELESVLAEALMRRAGTGVIGPEMVAGRTEETSGPAPAAPDPLHAVIEIRRLALARAAFERLVLLRALRRAAGSRVRAARELGISRQSLWQKLRRHGIP